MFQNIQRWRMQNVLGTKGTTYSIDTLYCIRSKQRIGMILRNAINNLVNHT